MYRLVVESLLGLQVENGRLRMTPVLRAGWTSYRLHYRFRSTTYRIDVKVDASHEGNSLVTLDGQPQPDGFVRLLDDQRPHEVVVRMSAVAPSP